MTRQPEETDARKLEKLEEELWQEETRFDVPYMQQVMARDFLEIGRSGRLYDRQECLSHPPQPIDAVLPLPELAIRMLTPDVAQVTYNSHVTYDGELLRARRSSIWRRAAESWELVFHQGTPY